MAITLAQLRKYALSLPGSIEEPHFERTSFRVSAKIFVTAKPDEPYAHVFVGEELREPALAAHPDCMAKLPWGPKVVGLRIHLPKAPAGVVKDLVKAAWQARAQGAARMNMKKMGPPAESPAAYVDALSGWRKTLVASLRRATRAGGKLTEEIKWGHLVYSSSGPVLYIRAEGEFVCFGFWRGQRLREIEPRLKPGGRYEMATVQLSGGDRIKSTQVTRLAKAAIALNRKFGDPRDAAGTR